MFGSGLSKPTTSLLTDDRKLRNPVSQSVSQLDFSTTTVQGRGFTTAIHTPSNPKRPTSGVARPSNPKPDPNVIASSDGLRWVSGTQSIPELILTILVA